MQPKVATGLLVASVVLLGLGMIVETRPAIAAQGTTRCCLPDGTCVNIDPLVCVQAGGTPGGAGDLCSDGPCPVAGCPWDCGGDDDGNVGIVDFLALLAQWGTPGTCDFDGGGVGIVDFLALLAHWGACP